MKSHITLLSLALAATSMAGVSEVIETRSQEIVDRGWTGFAGGSVSYLFDYDEPMYSLNAGVKSPWSPWGWNVAFSLEWASIEDDNESEIPYHVEGAPVDLQIYPLMANVKFEKMIGSNFGVYFGGGLGAAFTEIIVDQDYRDQDVVLAAQLFAGMSFYVGEHSEIYAGGRWIHFDDTENYDLTQTWAAELGYRWHF